LLFQGNLIANLPNFLISKVFFVEVSFSRFRENFGNFSQAFFAEGQKVFRINTKTKIVVSTLGGSSLVVKKKSGKTGECSSLVACRLFG
jgi:hypothetical protein